MTATKGTRTLRALGAFVVVAALGSAACGSSSSTFPSVSVNPETFTGDAAPNLVSSAGATSRWIDGGPDGSFAACATSALTTRLSRVNLVFVYDKSGSMGDPAEGGDPNVKWIPLENGMTAFFSDPASQWISASLTLFPAPGDLQTTCSYPYQTPNVALAPLSGSNAILSLLQSTMPQGGTPTLPALQGGIAYAQQIVASDPTDVTAVVLVTDGEPGFYVNGQSVAGCTNNDLPDVEAAAQAAVAASPSIPTYVIGVGTDIDAQNANAIAAAGGTTNAFMISVADPSMTAGIFAQALASIRTASTSCSVPFPSAPSGQTIDPAEVNVVLTSSGAGDTVVAQDPSCTGGVGWYYDNPTTPAAIDLCPSTCDSIRSGGGSLDLAFGCATMATLLK